MRISPSELLLFLHLTLQRNLQRQFTVACSIIGVPLPTKNQYFLSRTWNCLERFGDLLPPPNPSHLGAVSFVVSGPLLSTGLGPDDILQSRTVK